MAAFQTAAAVLLVLSATIQAQAQQWRQVERLKPGTTIIVAGTQAGMAYQMGDRCRIVAVDAQALLCKEQGWHAARLIYPAAQVETVYRVRQKFPLWSAVGLAIFGVFVGGLASGSTTAIEIGLIGGLVGLFAAMAAAERRGWDAIWGRPRPPPDDETLELVYYRDAATATPPLASIP